jgi:hypothetical protein
MSNQINIRCSVPIYCMRFMYWTGLLSICASLRGGLSFIPTWLILVIDSLLGSVIAADARIG